ncbi:unnamed protein product [Urochloa humidicola]
MGGHGGLNILPQKRWNVYNFDNREKVRNDEAAAAREEQLQREAERRRESDLRVAALRRNRGLVQAEPPSATAPPPPAGGAAAEDPAEDALPSPASDGDHINLFSGRSGAAADFAALASASGGRGAARERDPEANPSQKNPKKRKKEEEVRAVGPDEEKYRLGYGLAGKGVAVPWYMSSPTVVAAAKEGRGRDAGEGSGGKRSGGKKSIEELREERRKREAKEKERERAVLAVAGRKERQADRGRPSRWAR